MSNANGNARYNALAGRIEKMRNDFNLERPLVVGISGLPGSGKTTMSMALVEILAGHGLKAVVLSLDDFYYPANRLQKIGAESKSKLYEFRGSPGTHDVSMLVEIIRQLSDQFASVHGKVVKWPLFDKTAHLGMGDRVVEERWNQATLPVDIILVEGWMLGLLPLSSDELEATIGSLPADAEALKYEKAELHLLNDSLLEYQQRLYPKLDAFVRLQVKDIKIAYEWRREAEARLAKEGGSGMDAGTTDDFVSRLMPAYELFLPALSLHGLGSITTDRQLCIELNEDRQFIGISP